MSDAVDRLLAVWDRGEAAGGEHDLDGLSRVIEALRAAYMTETTETVEYLSAELVCRSRRTGVIVGTTEQVTNMQAAELREKFQGRFPGVVFAVMPGAYSVAFEFDDTDDEATS